MLRFNIFHVSFAEFVFYAIRIFRLRYISQGFGVSSKQ